LVKGFDPTPSGVYSLWCPTLDTAGTDRRSFQALIGPDSKKAANAQPNPPTPPKENEEE